MTKILNARYTNDIKDNIKLLYESEEDGVYEMDIEPGSAEAIEAEKQGWTEKEILNATAENKRLQMYEITEIAKAAANDVYSSELKVVLKRKVEAEALHKTTVEQYRTEIKKLMQRQVEAESLHKTTVEQYKNEIKRLMKRQIEAESLILGKEKEILEATQKVNDFIKSTLSTEDKEDGMEKVIEFLSALDTKEVTKKLKDAGVIF